MEEKSLPATPAKDSQSHQENTKSTSQIKALLLEGSKKEWQNLLEEIGDKEQLAEIAAIITSSWQLLDEKQEYVASTKLIEAGETVHNGNFPYLLCLELIEATSYQGACRVFSEACKQALNKNRKGVGPSTRMLPLKSFLSENLEVLVALPMEKLNGEKKKKTIDALLQAIFVKTGKKTTSRFIPEEQLRVLQILAGKFESLDIYNDESEVPDHITKSITRWPLTLTEGLGGVFASLPLQSRKVLSELIQMKVGKPTSSSIDSPAISQDDGESKETMAKVHGPKSFKETLALVESFHLDLEGELSRVKQQVDELKKHADGSAKLKELLEAKSKRIQELQGSKDMLVNQLKDLEGKHRECKAEVHEGHKKIKKLKKQLEEERDSHKGITEMLGRKVDTESVSQLRVFKESLASELNNDYMDANRIANTPMTLERGEILSHSFQELFKKLEALGVEFKGKQ